jgi:hypothetical protein
MENNSLMPVLQITSLNATWTDGKRAPLGKRKARKDGPGAVRPSSEKRALLPA